MPEITAAELEALEYQRQQDPEGFSATGEPFASGEYDSRGEEPGLSPQVSDSGFEIVPEPYVGWLVYDMENDGRRIAGPYKTEAEAKAFVEGVNWEIDQEIEWSR